ncbi:thiosulfate oxidation carrier protein SoxY [Jannaschia ovalis]|uniref:Thiosulfate oxidation carrier protein SoxY n=1 Tax=Jannaschia ovalis TaxID=3038773 RepID=A0ABY8LE93_9RHOB|nr:thiosulfate oxidation carrier protein SoxY [Jannaschia sp. GRR-S6-38]WGH79632.1 thiosulfate oxidation carrier protein SoxY [Jannaschia sp. GRR-S6-38]
MQLTRRDALLLGGSALALTALPMPALAATEGVDAAINAFTGGAEVGSGGISLTAPEIAENGNTVPIEVSAPGAASIMLLAAGNPNPDVGTFHFGPLAASQFASTRIRLAGTQDVIAIAKMADGSFVQASQEVKVTIGGCGG